MVSFVPFVDPTLNVKRSIDDESSLIKQDFLNGFNLVLLALSQRSNLLPTVNVLLACLEYRYSPSTETTRKAHQTTNRKVAPIASMGTEYFGENANQNCFTSAWKLSTANNAVPYDTKWVVF